MGEKWDISFACMKGPRDGGKKERKKGKWILKNKLRYVMFMYQFPIRNVIIMYYENILTSEINIL